MPLRYSFESGEGEFPNKYPREICLLRSVGGCSWGKCTFCDYKDDFGDNVQNTAKFNQAILKNITGKAGVLEIINSASFSELTMTNIFDIHRIIQEKNIETLITEQHWIYRFENNYYREFFKPVKMKFICGVETFDENIRENIYKKGMPNAKPVDISQYFQWVNLLFGIEGACSFEGLKRDIEIGFEYFERINLCIFEENTTKFKRDRKLVQDFYNSLFFSEIKNNSRIEILDYADEFKKTTDTLLL